MRTSMPMATACLLTMSALYGHSGPRTPNSPPSDFVRIGSISVGHDEMANPSMRFVDHARYGPRGGHTRRWTGHGRRHACRLERCTSTPSQSPSFAQAKLSLTNSRSRTGRILCER